MKQARIQKAFTLVEMIIVIIILAILAATAIPKFINFSDESHDQLLENTAGAFKTAIMAATMKHKIQGEPGSLTLSSGTIYFNDGIIQQPYPVAANSNPGTGGGSVMVTDYQCRDLFMVLLDSNQSITNFWTNAPNDSQINGAIGSYDWFTVKKSGNTSHVCLFHYLNAGDASSSLNGHRFEYDHTTGVVTVYTS